jgi:Amt family ammonium transporter
VSPLGALAIGLIAGGVCFGAVLLKSRIGYDDSLDAFGIHGVGGALGALLTGVFASAIWNSPSDPKAGKEGLLGGNAAQFGEQLFGVVVAGAYAALMTFVLLKVLDAWMGLRVDEETEREGLDASLHGEEAYHSGQGAEAINASAEP